MFASNVRVGLGYDVHRIEPGRPLVLGGVPLEGPLGLAGHSDADAILHAVIDAILGAAGGPDLGTLFPDTDDRWRGASSVDLARIACRPVLAEWEVANLDVVVRAETIRIAPVRSRLVAGIAAALEIPADRVNVKGKTGEGLGPVGENRAVECQAVVCLVRRKEIDR